MKPETEENIMAFICGLLLFCCIFIGTTATAGEDWHKPKVNNITHNNESHSESSSVSDASSSSDNSVQVGGDSVENNSSNVVLVPNNNTESCLRVWGIAWGEGGKSGALGIPWRSKKCDFEQAADDAFAAGERELGWFWKCQNKNLYSAFRDKGMSKEEAQERCHAKAVGEINNLQTIGKLRDQLAIVNNERAVERENCKESKNRIADAWQESCKK